MNYLIISSFYRLNNKLISEIIDDSSEVIKMDLNSNTLEEIVDEAQYNSLFNNKKTIIVYNCNIFGSDKIDDNKNNLLVSYLQKSNPNCLLLFIQSEPIDNRKKIVKLIKEEGKLLDYSKIKYADLLKYINDYLKSNEWQINNEILNYIIKNFNNNYDLILNELDKLKLAYPNEVTLEQAKKIISNNINDNIFKLVDEIINKNIEKANSILHDLKICKIDPSVIINMIYREFRHMYLYKIAILNNIDINMVFKNESLMDWQIGKISDSSRKYKISDIQNIIKILANYDYKYKSGKIDRSITIELLLLEICN